MLGSVNLPSEEELCTSWDTAYELCSIQLSSELHVENAVCFSLLCQFPEPAAL